MTIQLGVKSWVAAGMSSRLHHLADDLVLLLGDVELVEPADDLDLLPVGLGDGGDQLADQGVGLQQAVRQQQLGLVVHRLEQEGHRLVQGAALGEQQVPVQLLVAGAVHLQRDDPLAVQPRQLDVLGLLQDLRHRTIRRVAQHAEAVIQIAVQLHEADGGEAVEPGVGGGLHDLLEALLPDALDESLALAAHGLRVRLTLDEDQLALLPVGLDLRGGQSEGGGAAGDGGDEVAAGLGGVGLELVGLHGGSEEVGK